MNQYLDTSSVMVSQRYQQSVGCVHSVHSQQKVVKESVKDTAKGQTGKLVLLVLSYGMYDQSREASKYDVSKARCCKTLLLKLDETVLVYRALTKVSRNIVKMSLPFKDHINRSLGHNQV